MQKKVDLSRIGFMQGRLSPLVAGRIQAFPLLHWQEEFRLAGENNLRLMEWTLDHEGLHENPLLTTSGQKQIKALVRDTGVNIHSVTGDNFMQAPYYKVDGHRRRELLEDFRKIIEACAELDISYVVFPLVDKGHLESKEQEVSLRKGLEELGPLLRSSRVRVIFESELGPIALKKFMDDFDAALFGINFDIGNSASLGFDPEEEISTYGSLIANVHVKDRKLHGTTVPLGEGDAKFEKVFRMLRKIKYDGNFILQTARSQKGDHLGDILKYREMVSIWIDKEI